MDIIQSITTQVVVIFTTVLTTVTSFISPPPKNIVSPLQETIRTATESAQILISPTIKPKTTSAPKVAGEKTHIIVEDITNTPTPTLIPTQTAMPTIPLNYRENRANKYSIIPIGIMNIGSMESHLQIIAQKAYQEFLKTSNLNQLDESTQMELLVGIYARMLREEIVTTQQNISQLTQENTPTPTIFYSQEIENSLSQLNQTLTGIENTPVAMNIIEGKKNRAYQDWVNNNQGLYSTIQNTHYKTQLNTILSSHGL